MSSIASLGAAASGLMSSQKGLEVTGHNIANVNTPGFTRQQLLQNDSGYKIIGNNGNYNMQLGVGVSDTEIRQIRDQFADIRFRNESSVLSFYQTKSATFSEIENILDEPYGSSLSSVLENFWSQTQKFSANPSGVEERMSFVETSFVLIERANQIQSGLNDYQNNLNQEVVDTVNRINDIAEQLDLMNEKVVMGELNADNANDFRDQRNLLLDELSSYIDIDYEEQKDGLIVVKTNTRSLVDRGFITKLELAQTEPMSPYLKPVWADTKDDVFKFTNKENGTNAINSNNDNDNGKLKALLVSRGSAPANKDTSWSDIAINDKESIDQNGNSYIIPEIQKKLDILISEVVDIVNSSLDGKGIGQFQGVMGEPIFVPIQGGPIAPVLPDNPTAAEIATYNTAMAQYHVDIKPYLTTTNIQINPIYLEEGGYNRIGTVEIEGNIGDNQKVQELLDLWESDKEWFVEYDASGNVINDVAAPHKKEVDMQGFYAEILGDLGQDGFETINRNKEKQELVQSIDNERLSRSAVSQDEELANMMKYQYAYNASARMITMLDGMMDTIINKM